MPPRSRLQILAAMSEAELQRQVEDMLRLAHWPYYHAPDNAPIGTTTRHVQQIQAGFPDIIAIGRGRLVALELKREAPTARPTAQQLLWLKQLREAADAFAAVIRPRHLPMLAQLIGRSRPLVWPPIDPTTLEPTLP